MNFTDDEVLRYLKNWVCLENYTDFNLFLDAGYVELAIRTLVEAGAIDPGFCDPEFQDIETYILKLDSKLSKKMHLKLLKECLKDVEIWVESHTNQTWFIDRNIHISAPDTEELNDMGFVLQE